MSLLVSKEVNAKADYSCVILQESIRDKLRGVPIDVSVDIQEAKRKRRQSSASQLGPVLDASVPMTTRKEVCLHEPTEGIIMLTDSRRVVIAVSL